MNYQNFQMCNRLAYAFSLIKTRPLEQVMDNETIYYDCSEVAKSFTLQGREAILNYLNKLFKNEQRRKMTFFSTVVTDLYIQGVFISRLDGKSKDKVFVVRSENNIIEKITVHNFKSYRSLTFHPGSHFCTKYIEEKL